VIVLPTREPILLAKQAATLDQISRGRFVLGIGVGAGPDDYAVSGTEFSTRGKRLNSQLEILHRAWRGELVGGSRVAVCPTPHNGRSVPVMFGGRADAAVARVAKYGIGYTQGAGTPEGLKAMIERVNAAWKEAGREGRPEFRALTYFVLGDEAQGEAQSNVLAYYGEYGKNVWANAFKSAAAAKERVQAYVDAGCDEMLAFLTAPSLAQVERLAEAVL
jgi:alkanesulfonate monooxygenase SsuD/methylene tetrahydromethanopterin reductase-like flavin-dependent oxidoreductase (luciferase family)